MNFQAWIRERVRNDPVKYQPLKARLVSARMGIPIEHYLRTAYLLALVAALGFAAAICFISGIILASQMEISVEVTRELYGIVPISFPEEIFGIATSSLTQCIITILAFLLGFYSALSLALRYPASLMRGRASRINLSLHNAVAYMYAMRKGGAELLPIFRSISENAGIYGESALEFRQVVRDAELFGYDVISALRNLMETTPSEKMKQFLEDMVSVIESGGDLTAFLAGRVRMYQEEARFEQKQYLNVLALIAESYVTLFVAGPLFLIIIMVVMGMMGGGSLFQLTVMAYALLPIGSLIFLILIDLIGVRTQTTAWTLRVKVLNEYAEVPVAQPGKDETTLFSRLARYDRYRTLMAFLRHPFEALVRNYHLTLYVTVPLAIAYAVSIIINAPPLTNIEHYVDVIDDQLIVALIIILLPYGFFYELWRKNILGMESLIPDFLDRMAGINRVGLTIAQAIAIMVNTNLGLLSYEILRIKRDMDWGANFSDALVRFERRVHTPMIARTVSLITKASEMSGSIGDVLTIAASDAKMSEILKRDRLAEMFVYTAIVYLAFIVFVFVIAVIVTQFLPVLAGVSLGGIPGGASASVLSRINTIPIETFGRIMYHTCLIQAFFSGLIAGQMGEGSIAAGVKHGVILLVIALVIFNFFI